jgi:NAD(P)-dependent dehydrogenase (short-subunit alcohol dehydrogenase family)
VSVDIREPRSIAAMYDQIGRVDAVACAAGGAPYKPLTELSYEDLQAGTTDKLLGQVELVRQGIAHVADHGSFTVITGILARHPIRTGAASSVANGALESFVRAAAIELPRGQRINAVSPTVFTEALDVYGSYFPGFLPVPLRDVAATYVRSIEGAETGRVYELGN